MNYNYSNNNNNNNNNNMLLHIIILHAIKINDENTVIFENLPKINNMSFDNNYFNYFNNIISTTFDIPTYKFNSSFNYSFKSIIIKLIHLFRKIILSITLKLN